MSKAPVLILLAGGRSSRMGLPKGLLDFNGIPWILEQISRYRKLQSPRVYIGLGYDNNLYFNNITWFKAATNNFYPYNGVEVKVIINQQPELGAFSTLQTVLTKIEKDSEVLVQPIDIPLLNVKELQNLVAIENLVVIPTFNGKNGHPVKLAPEFWNELLNIDITSEEARLDFQIKKESNPSITYLNVFDVNITQNINTLRDWDIYLKNTLNR